MAERRTRRKRTATHVMKARRTPLAYGVSWSLRLKKLGSRPIVSFAGPDPLLENAVRRTIAIAARGRSSRRPGASWTSAKHVSGMTSSA